MLYAERVNIILKQLELNSIVKTDDLCKLLNVSIDTVRRDLKNLEKDGLIICVRGGACLPDKMKQFSDYIEREIINIELKREVAQKAVSLIQKNDLIAINSGTTTTLLAQEILTSGKKCTVITNNMAVASTLMKSHTVTVIVLGGTLDNVEQFTYGERTLEELQTYLPDLAFISMNAVHPDNGFTDFRINDIATTKLMARNSKKSIVVMDSTKLDKTSKKILFTPQEIDLLCMDDQITPAQKKLYKSKGFSFL